jgi:hypothetical protein
MRWTKAQFTAFSQQIKVRSVAAQDTPRAERDRLLQVKREHRILTEAQIQEPVESRQADGTRKAQIEHRNSRGKSL